MSTKIESIHVAPTSESRSVPGRFETTLRGAAAGLAHGIADGVQLAAPFVPGGTVISAAVRVGAGALAASGTTAIFINQLREKIGVFFGSPETTTGGKALKFYSSVRMDIRRIETLKEGGEAVGNRTRVKVVKNKMAPPFKQAEFDIIYGVGISREGSLIDLGVEHGLVRKSGSWFTYEGDQLGQGKENARSFLRDNPDLAVEIEKKIKEKLGIGATLDAPADPAAGVDF